MIEIKKKKNITSYKFKSKVVIFLFFYFQRIWNELRLRFVRIDFQKHKRLIYFINCTFFIQNMNIRSKSKVITLRYYMITKLYIFKIKYGWRKLTEEKIFVCTKNNIVYTYFIWSNFYFLFSSHVSLTLEVQFSVFFFNMSRVRTWVTVSKFCFTFL